MADQRQPFRFRLPWLPPTATPAPPPTPAPSRPVAEPRPPRQPAAAPTPAPAPARPPRPAAAAPTPAPARSVAEPQPSRQPAAAPTPAPARPVAEPQPSRQPAAAPTPAPARPVAEPQPSRQPAAAPARPPFRPSGVGPTQPPPPTPAPPKATEQASAPKSTSPPKTEPPSKPIAPTPLQPAPPKPGSPKEAKATTSRPISPPKQPPMPPSPSGSPARRKPSSPSSSSAASPREKALTKPHNSPKREPSPALPDQSSPSKKEPEKPEAQPPTTVASENASDSSRQSQTTMISDEVAPNPIQNGEPRKKEVTEVPESETVLQPVEVVHRKEMITKSQRIGNPHHNHKPAAEKAPSQKEIKEDVSKFVHKLGTGQGKQTLDGDKQLTVITLAGENRGAAMTLSNESRKKESSIHIQRRYRANPDEGVENSRDGEEGSETDEETATKAYINSNVQGINNSLLFNGSVSTMNPGVRYVRNYNTPETNKGTRHDHEGIYATASKAEFSGTHSEMLAYAPTVRRRCLRGLLMESSDSDTEKPRRHGCRYECKDKNKDANVDIL